MTQQLIHIDLWRLLQKRMGRKGRYLPHWAVRPFERLVRQEQMNEMLAKLYPKRGTDFCLALLKELDISLEAVGLDRLPASPRCIFTCNHPLGGLDGVCLLAFLRLHYGVEPKAVVNDMLMAVDPLADNFVPINKFGSQKRANALAVDSALEGDAPILYFPAGLVSRLQPDGSIVDLKWHKSVVNKAIRSGRPIVPLYFDGLNNGIFYRLAYWRKKLGIKVNLELALLPREVFLGRGATYKVLIDKPIYPQELKGGEHAAEEILRVRRRTYDLIHNLNSESTEIL